VGKPPPEEKYPPEGGGFKPKKMENKILSNHFQNHPDLLCFLLI
jgi:hypothetical protein